MNKINANKEQLMRANYERQRALNRNANELKNIREAHKEQKEKLSDDSKTDLELKKIEHSKRFLDESQKQEEAMNLLKDNLQKTKETLEAEQKRLKDYNSQQLTNQKSNFEKSFQLVNQNQSRILDDLNDHSEKEMIKINDRQKKALEDSRYEHRYKKLHQGMNHDHVLSTQKSVFTNTFNSNEVKYNNALTDQKDNFEKMFEHTNNLHKEKVKQMDAQHRTDIERINFQQNRRLNQLQRKFENKYSAMMKTHQDQLMEFDQLRQRDLNRYAFELSDIKEDFTTKAEDPFYRSTSMPTKVVDKGNFYEISTPLPEHEEQGVTISGKGRNIKLTFSRSFEREVVLPDNSVDRSQKFESMVRNIEVPQIVDPKTVRKEYNDGMVIFKVKKA